MMRTIQLIIFVFLIENQLINCQMTNQCIYQIETSDNKSVICLGNDCSNYFDIKQLISQSQTCQTTFLSLAFSSYKNFISFRNKLQYKLSDLFLSSNNNRSFYLYINKLDYDDNPLNQSELIQLGTNIDFYFLFIQNIQNQNRYQRFIHRHSNDQKWNLIKIHTRCRQLKGFDEYPCSPYLIIPSIFPFQKFSSIQFGSTISFIQIQNSTFPSMTNSHQNKAKSNQLISIIIISSIILFFTLVIFLILYLCLTGKCSCCMYRNQSESSSTTDSLSNQNNSQKNSVSSLTISHETNQLEINHFPICNDDQVNSETISVIGQQYFVPISSSSNF